MKNWVRVATAAMAIAALSGCAAFKGHGKKTPVLGERVPILASENDISADRTLNGVDVLLPAPAVNTDWAQPGGNAAKSMGTVALADSLSNAWSVEIPGTTKKVRLGAAPVVAAGKLYVMDTTGTVHAFAADTGARLWETSTVTGKVNNAARFGGGVSVDGARAFATNGLGDIVALDATNGSEIWRAHPGGPLRGAPTVANGNLYVETQDNQLFALGQDKGDVLWPVSASLESQGVFGVAAPAVASSTVVAGYSSGELNAYRYENGHQLWGDVLSRSSISTSVSSLSDIDAEPVIDQGRVYAVGQGGRMVAMDLATGTRLWEQNIAGISTPWVAGEWVFVVTDDARLLCVARGTGKVRWIAQLQHFKNTKKSKNPIGWTGPVLAGNRLVLVNTEGQIVSVSPTDGSVIGKIETKGSFSIAPIVANQTLYVLNDKGRLTAYR
jgi:outer membrane protein assembly factor BamB